LSRVLDKKARFVAFFSVAVVVVVDGTMAKKKETRLGRKEKRKRERKRERKAKKKKEGLETFLPFNDTINFVFNCFEGIFQTK